MARKKEKENTGRSWKLTLLMFLVLIFGSSAILFTMDARHVQFRLVGGVEITVPYGVDYVDPGRTAVSVGKIFGPGFLTLPVESSGYVNTRVIGTYELTYSTEYLFDTYTVKRIVHVADITPPVITLQKVMDYNPSWFTGYEEEGYLAWDDWDGDLTAQVQRIELGDRIEYRVTDSSGNEGVAVRDLSEVAVPTLTLLGEQEVTLDACLSYEDPGFVAVDGVGRDLSEFVTQEGEVRPSVPGTYTIEYSLVNDREETVSQTRTVTVKAVEIPPAVQPGEKTIYLTFDDGPGPYTAQLLDLLAAYDVKATFFVTCMYPEYEDLVGRAFREGHSIGVHTASHNYKKIYESEENFLDDFFSAQEMVKKQTGDYTRIFRFAGGSSNEASRFNPGIMSRLVVLMNDLGYQFYDWHVDSMDAGGTRSSEVVAANVISACSGRTATIVLQHDTKDYSVAAVEKIIQWGKEKGYTFKALELGAPTAHGRLAN